MKDNNVKGSRLKHYIYTKPIEPSIHKPTVPNIIAFSRHIPISVIPVRGEFPIRDND